MSIFNRMQLCTIYKLCMQRYVLFESRESMIDSRSISRALSLNHIRTRCLAVFRAKWEGGERLVMNGLRIFIRIRIFESTIEMKSKSRLSN